MGSEFEKRNSRNSVRTTNATPAIAIEFDIASATSGFIKVDVALANNTRTTVYAIGKRRAYRQNSGTLTLAGTEAAVYADGDAGLATAAVAIIVSGTKVQIQVTGIAATTIDWLVNVDWSVN